MRKQIQVTINEKSVRVLRSDLAAIAEMVDLKVVGIIEGNGYWLETPNDYDAEDYDLTSSDVVNAILDGIDFCGLN